MLGADVSVDGIASATDGFSGSDLRQLCATAAMRPVRELLAASGKSAAADAAATAGSAGSAGQTASGAAAAAAGTKVKVDTEGSLDTAAAAPGADATAVGGGGGADAQPAAREAGNSNQARSVSVVGSAADGTGDAGATSTASSSSSEIASTDVALANGSTPAGGERALLGQLLAECEAVAVEAASSHPAALRPVSAADFADAQRDVAPSVAPDSATMAELRAWNAQYGEGGSRDAWNPKLSYFM